MREQQKATRGTSTLEQFLSDKAEERREKYNIEVIDNWPRLFDVDTLAFLGMFSWSMPNAKRRLLYRPNTIDRGNGIQTPTEIVRDYLDWKYPDRLRCVSEQHAAITAHRAFPCMAIKGNMESAAYVDLKSAYWTITQAVGWDVDYFPGRWLGVRSTMEDFPLGDHKAARSSLVTSGLSSPIRMWTGSKLKWKNGGNVHINYGLWAFVQDVLHGVASEMLEIGAQYVHTDGYIVPGDRALDALDIVDSWGLKGSIKHAGDAEIFGVGVYRIGNYRTKRDRAVPMNNHIYVNPVERDWIKRKFRFYALRWWRKCS